MAQLGLEIGGMQLSCSGLRGDPLHIKLSLRQPVLTRRCANCFIPVRSISKVSVLQAV